MGGMVLLIGRVVFSFFFLYSGFNHLTKLSTYAQYAGASGVPAPTVLTALSGLMLLAGGLSVLLGFKVRWGSLLIAAFLVPAAFTVHKFWGITDPMMQQMFDRFAGRMGITNGTMTRQQFTENMQQRMAGGGTPSI